MIFLCKLRKPANWWSFPLRNWKRGFWPIIKQ